MYLPQITNFQLYYLQMSDRKLLEMTADEYADRFKILSWSARKRADKVFTTGKPYNNIAKVEKVFNRYYKIFVDPSIEFEVMDNNKKQHKKKKK